jgi:hypothetical protein
MPAFSQLNSNNLLISSRSETTEVASQASLPARERSMTKQKSFMYYGVRFTTRHVSLLWLSQRFKKSDAKMLEGKIVTAIRLSLSLSLSCRASGDSSSCLFF